MRYFIWSWGALVVLGGCALQPAPLPARAPAQEPMQISATAFSIRGPHFTPGEVAVVKVCVHANGAIASSSIVQSSGEKRFDESAVQWALRAAYRPMRVGGLPIYSCDDVRVEMHQITSPGAGIGPESSLG